jgi:Fe-S-cluster containining protein
MADRKQVSYLYREYETVSALVDAEFRRNAKRFINHPAPVGGTGLQCRRGCTACCSQLFTITLLEAAYIGRHSRTLPPQRQQELRRRAEDYQPQREKLLRGRAAERWAEQVEGRLPLEGLRLACPALDSDGSCAIYPARPLVCRKFGMPLYNPRRPGKLGACELNFSTGEEIDSAGIVENQTRIFERWESTKDAVREVSPDAAQALTVADALLEDFDRVLREQP